MSAQNAARSPETAKAGLSAAITLTVLAIGGGAVILSQWLRGGVPYWLFFDDFYYYLVVVDAWVFDGEMSFFPGVETNGFQPLWFFLIAALRWGLGTSDAALLGSLSVIMWLSQLATLWLGWRLALRSGAAAWSSLLAVFAAGLQFIQIASFGAEVAFTVPLLMVLVWRLLETPLERQSPGQLLATGALAGVICLSRLDAAILVLAVGLPSLPALLRSPRRLLPLVVGGLPFPVYLLWAALRFGSLLPVSGAAKQLKPDLIPSIEPMLKLFSIAAEAWPIGVFGLALIVFRLAVQRPRGVEAGYLAGVLAYYLVHSTLSDWMLWFWYLYPLVPALVIAGPPVFRSLGLLFRMFCSAVFAAGFVVFVGINLTQGPLFEGILHPLAREVAQLTRERPGVYAMGDRAGMAAHLSESPILQTEGLVMDHAFLENIRRQADLVEVLRGYGVEYYLTFEATSQDGCWLVREPSRAGPASPTMQGRFCADPLEVRSFYKSQKLYVFAIPPATPTTGPEQTAPE